MTDLTTDELIAQIHALGYYCLGMEVTETWCMVMAWRKYARPDGIGNGAPTMNGALSRLLERLAKENTLCT